MAAARETFTSLPSVQFRAMNPLDVAAVMKIERAAYTFPWSEGIFRDCLRVGYVCQVVEIAEVLAGYCVMSIGAYEAHVLNLCVRDQYRCRGVGGLLLAHLLELARATGAAEAFLEVRPSNTAAIRLYQSQGFTQVGVRRGYYQAVGGREDAVVLRRQLSPG